MEILSSVSLLNSKKESLKMKVMQDNKKYEEVEVDGETIIHSLEKYSNNKLIENQEVLREVTFEFDSNTGSILINLETFKNMNIELGRIADDIENTDSSKLTDMGLRFYDINHKILLLSTLFHYTVKELEENLEQTEAIRSSYFDIIVKP